MNVGYSRRLRTIKSLFQRNVVESARLSVGRECFDRKDRDGEIVDRCGVVVVVRRRGYRRAGAKEITSSGTRAQKGLARKLARNHNVRPWSK